MARFRWPCSGAVIAGAAIFIALGSAGSASADTLTFDGIGAGTPGGALVPANYGGLSWSNFYFLNATTDNTYGILNGYKKGKVSGDYVAFNGLGTSASVASGTFDFDSASLTGAWNDGLNISVQGFLGGNLKYSQTVIVNSTAPTLFHFDYVGIDRLVFNSFGGTNHGYGFIGQHFAMDNFTFAMTQQEAPTGIPLPGIASAGIALLGGAAVLRRRRR